MNDEFVIEKGIELPDKRCMGRPDQYPWKKMEIGDSFYIPGKTGKGFSSAVYGAAKRNGIKMSIRTVAGGLRIWRVE